MNELEERNESGLARLLSVLRAAGEETRLRILILLSHGELTVGDIATVLDQSQPRVSRHLKVLVEAGLVVRFKEGACSFHRLSAGAPGDLATPGPDTVGKAATDFGLIDDPSVTADLARLEVLKADRFEAAQRYFASHADAWDELRAGGVSVAAAVAAVRRAFEIVSDRRNFVDLGAGTGRMLVGAADLYDAAVGLDMSQAMLRVARANLETAGFAHVQARHGDLMAPPLPDGGFDGALLHQVLHYLEDAAGGVAAAARLLRPGGALVIVDLAPHEDETLREKHLHRRLGFSDEDIDTMAARAGLHVDHRETLPGDGDLSVRLWRARRGASDGLVVNCREDRAA